VVAVVLQTTVLLLVPGDLAYASLLGGLALAAGLVADSLSHRAQRSRDAELRSELEEARAEIAGLHELAREHDDDTAALIHEAKTPLSVLKLSVGRHEELDRLEHILETGLFASRARSFASDFLLQDVNLRPLVAQTAARFAPAFLARRLTFSLGEGSVTVLSDPKWLSFVLSQLLSNALKYVPEGGEVKVSFGSEPGDAWLAVDDNGPGFAAEDLPRLFDRGYTGHSRRTVESTGMGLYLAAQLCAKLGHHLQASNRSEGGARFELSKM
jgi:signal transduction histidine kinase